MSCGCEWRSRVVCGRGKSERGTGQPAAAAAAASIPLAVAAPLCPLGPCLFALLFALVLPARSAFEWADRSGSARCGSGRPLQPRGSRSVALTALATQSCESLSEALARTRRAQTDPKEATTRLDDESTPRHQTEPTSDQIEINSTRQNFDTAGDYVPCIILRTAQFAATVLLIFVLKPRCERSLADSFGRCSTTDQKDNSDAMVESCRVKQCQHDYQLDPSRNLLSTKLER